MIYLMVCKLMLLAITLHYKLQEDISVFSYLSLTSRLICVICSVSKCYMNEYFFKLRDRVVC